MCNAIQSMVQQFLEGVNMNDHPQPRNRHYPQMGDSKEKKLRRMLGIKSVETVASEVGVSVSSVYRYIHKDMAARRAARRAQGD